MGHEIFTECGALRLLTRALYTIVPQVMLLLPYQRDAKEKLLFWQGNVVKLNGQAVGLSPVLPVLSFLMPATQSLVGYSVEVGRQNIAHGT